MTTTTAVTTTAATTKAAQTAPPDADFVQDGEYFKYKNGESAEDNPFWIYIWNPVRNSWMETGNPNYKPDPAHTVSGDWD